MKRTQADPNREDYGPTLPPTEQEPAPGDTTQEPTAASALETGEFTEAGATKAAGTQADEDRPRGRGRRPNRVVRLVTVTRKHGAVNGRRCDP